MLDKTRLELVMSEFELKIIIILNFEIKDD